MNTPVHPPPLHTDLWVNVRSLRVAMDPEAPHQETPFAYRQQQADDDVRVILREQPTIALQSTDLVHLSTAEQRVLSRALLRSAKVLEDAPIDMVLHCPKCHMQHIDGPDTPVECDGGERAVYMWQNPPHRSHLCQNPECRNIWRPADVPTNGVAAVKTKGRDDSPL